MDGQKAPFTGPPSVFSSRVKNYVLNNFSILQDIDRRWPEIKEATGLERWQLDYYLATMTELSKHNPLPVCKERNRPEAEEATEQLIEEEEKLADLECKIEEGIALKTGIQVYPDDLFVQSNFASIVQLFNQSDDLPVILDETYHEIESILRNHLREIVNCLKVLARAKIAHHGGPDAEKVDDRPYYLVNKDIVQAALSLRPFLHRKDFISSDYANAVVAVAEAKDEDPDLDIDLDNFDMYDSTGSNEDSTESSEESIY